MFVCLSSFQSSLSVTDNRKSAMELEHRVNGGLGNVRNFSPQCLRNSCDFVPTKWITLIICVQSADDLQHIVPSGL